MSYGLSRTCLYHKLPTLILNQPCFVGIKKSLFSYGFLYCWGGSHFWKFKNIFFGFCFCFCQTSFWFFKKNSKNKFLKLNQTVGCIFFLVYLRSSSSYQNKIKRTESWREKTLLVMKVVVVIVRVNVLAAIIRGYNSCVFILF